MNEIQQYLVEEELEHYRDGWISRASFSAGHPCWGSPPAAGAAMVRSVAVVPLAMAQPEESPFHVREDDPSVGSEWISYPGSDGAQIAAYLAWPTADAAPGSRPGVAVCHMNRGLDAHTQDVARRFAKQGYVAIAPDVVSRIGPPSPQLSLDQWTQAYRQVAQNTPQDFASALEFLKQNPSVDPEKFAATGYCLGGGVVWSLSTIYPELRAAAPFYGGNPPLADVPNIKAAMLGVYGGLDTRLNEGIPAVQGAMDAAGTTYRIKIYPNSQHAFFADFLGSYNRETAIEASGDTLNWFAEHLGLPAPNLSMA